MATSSSAPPVSNLGWVAEEVRGLPTKLKEADRARLLESFAITRPGEEGRYLLEVPGGSARVCDAPSSMEGTSGGGVRGSFTYMYEYVMSRMGVRFPLSLFQQAVLRYLQVAPSQLHLNA